MPRGKRNRSAVDLPTTDGDVYHSDAHILADVSSITDRQLAAREAYLYRQHQHSSSAELADSIRAVTQQAAPSSSNMNSVGESLIDGVASVYRDVGDATNVCGRCGASFWADEQVKRYFNDRVPHYHKCCNNGRVVLPDDPEVPIEFRRLFENKDFMENIRAYNQMFSMTSFGANVDDTINRGSGPYVFKISGQIYHWIGSLCPEEDTTPRFCQLYIYDTKHEVENRLSHFGGVESPVLSSTIVRQLIALLDTYNKLVQLFRTAREKMLESPIPSFRIRLFNVVGSRQHDLPTSDAIGAIVFDNGPKPTGDYDVIIEYKGGTPQRVNKLHPSYMSLQFPLLFVHGQSGFHTGLTLRDAPGSENAGEKKMSMNMYYSFQLHERIGRFNLILRGGRLFQQYMVTVYCAIEMERLDYIRNKQKDIRNDYLAGVYDALGRGDEVGADIGSKVILPASFTGGPRYMYSHYLDALAICRVYGNPQFFITFTCNSKWPEINRHMQGFPTLITTDRADVIARVFNMKVRQFIDYLKDEEPFGKFRAVLYTIEFQKRGLPHCHTLLWVHSDARVFSSIDIDQHISAEIPDPSSDPCGYKVVSEMMMHGPCGLARKSAPCMQSSVCSKKFPKKYNDQTFFDKQGYVHYRRRATGVTVTKRDVKLDNSYVVPYNRMLCLIFHAHINVEYCGWSMLIKYLFKYISKGTDRVIAHISRPLTGEASMSYENAKSVDEIKNFVDARFLCPHEAAWRVFSFPIHHREPSVQVLAVHLENMQLVTFRSSHSLETIANDTQRKKTTLTEWLYYNRMFHDGRHLTYLEFPSSFVWYKDHRYWKKRKSVLRKSIGRLSFMHPGAGEVFFLRMLLCHQKGCKSFEDIRTVDGQVHGSFRSASQALGLLGDDEEWTTVLDESALSASAGELRSLFVHILLFCDVTNPLRLWKRHWMMMSDDIPLRAVSTLHLSEIHINKPDLEYLVLHEIEILLNRSSKSVQDFGLPTIPAELLENAGNRLVMEETCFDREALAAETLDMEGKMNLQQRIIYDTVIGGSNNGQQGLTFVYGHGGTGKTFLWRAIISALRSQAKIVLAVASSGIASLLLPKGQTAHSRFKLPLSLNEESLCNIKKKTQLATLLNKTDLIVWDEAPMNSRQCFEALDKTLKDITENETLLFGGKSVILGGDFRQTLPVKKKGNKDEILASSIVNSYLWPSFRVYSLVQNMRLQQPGLSDSQRAEVEFFSKWLLQIGEGTIGIPDDADPDNSSWVDIPNHFCILNNTDPLSELISFIYEDHMLTHPSANKLQQQVIVCPTNDDADLINQRVLLMVDSESKTYASYDYARPFGNDNGESEVLYPPEYLNSLDFPNYPPHSLHLKVGAPVMLLRNISVAGGLCNGTRMIITQLLSKHIEGEIITGTRVGERVFIPRITITYQDDVLPFLLKRQQLPIKVSYAMTINKSQGQSLHRIGIYLPRPVFGHGQLYVALSRATSPGGLKILIKDKENELTCKTKNIVYKDFLAGIKHGAQ